MKSFLNSIFLFEISMRTLYKNALELLIEFYIPMGKVITLVQNLIIL